MPTSSTLNTWAPNWVSMLAPIRPTTAPMKNEVVATMGMASSPAASAWLNEAAQRTRVGLAAARPTVTRRWPRKIRVSVALTNRLTTPRPIRSNRS